MYHGMDRHLQRIMDNAIDENGSSRPEQALDYVFTDARSAEYSFQSTSRQPDQDPMLLNDFGNLFHCSFPVCSMLTRISRTDRGSYGSETSRQPITTLNTGSARLSLIPRNIYAQSGSEPRAPTNAENHSRFAQNLRQGIPANHAPPLETNNFPNQQAPSPLTQLANNMFLQRPMPQASPEVTIFQRLSPNRLNLLQPRRQEITPPFNLSEYLTMFY